MDCKETRIWLDSYCDDEWVSTPERGQELEEHLKICTACSALKENQRLLHAAFESSSLRFKPPPGLEKRLRRALRNEEEKSFKPAAPVSWFWDIRLWAPLTSLALVILLAGRVFFPPQEDLAQEVASSHIRSLMANHLTDVQTSDQHVVKPWFNGKLDFSPNVQDFSEQGFPLVGGRLDYLGHRTVAALIYHRNLHPINLFVWPSDGKNESSPKSFTIQGYHLIHWTSQRMTYWTVSDLNLKELENFGDLIRRAEKE